MDFKKLALSVSGLFNKSRKFKVTEEMKELVGELSALYKEAVVAYYGVFRVNISGPSEEDAAVAMELPFGPCVLFPKIEWEQFMSGQREIRMNVILAKAKAASDKGEADESPEPAIPEANKNRPGGRLGPRPPMVGLPVDQEVEMEDNDGKQLEPLIEPTGGRSPQQHNHRVSFDLNHNSNDDRNRNRNTNRSNNRQRSRSRSRSRDRQSVLRKSPSRRNRERATASFDDQGFADIEIRGPSSNAV